MYPDIAWNKEPDLGELRRAYDMLGSDFTRAELKLQELSERGSVASAWYLGDAYSSGRDTPKNLEKAKAWYSKADSANWLPASYRLGRVHFEMNELSAAFNAFSRGAERSYSPAIFRLAMMYKEGQGTKKDIVEASRLLKKATSQGHLYAKRELSRIYLSGAMGILGFIQGILMFLALIFELLWITISCKWREPAFVERTLT